MGGLVDHCADIVGVVLEKLDRADDSVAAGRGHASVVALEREGDVRWRLVPFARSSSLIIGYTRSHSRAALSAQPFMSGESATSTEELDGTTEGRDSWAGLDRELADRQRVLQVHGGPDAHRLKLAAVQFDVGRAVIEPLDLVKRLAVNRRFQRTSVELVLAVETSRSDRRLISPRPAAPNLRVKWSVAVGFCADPKKVNGSPSKANWRTCRRGGGQRRVDAHSHRAARLARRPTRVQGRSERQHVA